MAVENGTDIIVSVGSTPVAYASTGTITINQDTPEITNKDSGGWVQNIAGVKSWSVSGTHMLDFGASYGATEIFANLKNGDLINVSFGKSGTSVYTGQAPHPVAHIDGRRRTARYVRL
jgi:predicted secreted protein